MGYNRDTYFLNAVAALGNSIASDVCGFKRETNFDGTYGQ
jgi:hypothetical protein